ncbi:MAG: hypothetical protein HZC14_01610 [Candidatus Niyogibacteria bacterium]|nr:hypothetical protein [Candidatus Niyogibacteria bacterium]
MAKIKKILKWGGISILVVFVALVIARMPHAYDKQKTEKQVAKIHATKLTLDDVLGKNLPPDPGAEADKTIAGIDANKNGIRDDVELAIFREYPDSAKVRAAALQYAMALQIGLTQVSNSATLVAMAQERSRAGGCLFKLGGIDEQMIDAIHREDSFKKLILNTDARKNQIEDVYDKYMVSMGSIKGKSDCDIDPASLLN